MQVIFLLATCFYFELTFRLLLPVNMTLLLAAQLGKLRGMLLGYSSLKSSINVAKQLYQHENWRVPKIFWKSERFPYWCVKNQKYSSWTRNGGACTQHSNNIIKVLSATAARWSVCNLGASRHSAPVTIVPPRMQITRFTAVDFTVICAFRRRRRRRTRQRRDKLWWTIRRRRSPHKKESRNPSDECGNMESSRFFALLLRNADCIFAQQDGDCGWHAHFVYAPKNIPRWHISVVAKRPALSAMTLGENVFSQIQTALFTRGERMTRLHPFYGVFICSTARVSALVSPHVTTGIKIMGCNDNFR
jgi:hypothetical protein